ncbi:phage tail tape measure protein [Alkanindiges illinoisensis]|uniref:phage tail tape measure protein n=1 Tax=Alkanindiges illinoisensis TaxID=197183 RepID=UPI0014196341|nr:phage tail tape measure protein [Alkanindiges illinoisensis]
MSKLDLSIIIKFVDRATQPIRQFQQNVQNTNQSIDRLTHAVDRLEQGLNGTSLSRYSRQLNTGSSNINRQSNALHELHQGYDKVAQAIDKVRLKSKSLSESLANSRVKLRQEAKGLGVGLLGAGFAASIPIKAFADAEDASTKLKISMMDSSGKVASEYEAINKLATRLGTQLPGTNADFQLMMTNLVQQGISFKSILGGTGEAAGNLAVLLKMPFDQAAEFAAKMQDATGTAEKDMLSLMDTIQRTSYLGVDSTNMLGGFAKLGAGMRLIKQMGLEGSKAMAPLLVMADQSGMTDLSSAGNAYSKVFKAMLDQGEINKTLKKQKSSFALDFSNGKGEFGGLDKMFKELTKLKNLNTQQRMKVIEGIFGNDAETMQVLNLLIDKGKQGYEDTIAKMQRQADLQTRIKASLSTLTNLWDQAKGSMTNALVDIVSTISPELKEFVNRISSVAEKISIWAKANPELIRTIANIALKLLMFKVAMLGVRYTGNLLFGTIFSMIAGITKLSLMFWLLSKAADKFGINLPNRFTLITRGLRLLIQNFGFLARNALPLVLAGLRMLAVGLLTNPLTLIITGIAVAALLIYKYWAPIKAFFTGFWEGLTSGFSATRLIISDFFDSIAPAVEPIKPVWNWLVDKFTIFKGVLGEIFTPFAATNDQLQTANQAGQTFGTWVAIVTSALLAMKVALIAVSAIQGLVAFFSTLTVGLSGAAVAAWSFMAPFLPIIALVALLAGLVYLVIKNWEPIEEFFSDLGTSITEKFTSVKQSITDKFAPIGSWFGARMTEAKTAFGGGIGGMSKLITNWSPLGLFYSAFAKVLSWFGIDLPAKFTDFGSLIINGLINGLTSGFEKLKGVWANIKASMSSFSFSTPAYSGAPANPALAKIPIVTPPMVSKIKPVQLQTRPAAAPVHVQGDTIHMNIHPTPGMSPQQIAQQVRTEMDRRDQQKQARARASYNDNR